MQERTCKNCSLTQEIEKFPAGTTYRGKQYYRHLCVDCFRESKQPRKDAIRQEYYALKESLSCEVCGESDHRVLEFNHIDRDKKSFAVSDGVRRGFGIDRIKEEIKKCQVLCANCHRRKTWVEVWKNQ